MSRSRGALTKTMVDRYYPHQVMLKNDAKMRKHLWAISGQAAQLGASALGHHFYFDEETAHYSVYCFLSRENAELFQAAWCAEWLTPEDRKKSRWRPRSSLGPMRP